MLKSLFTLLSRAVNGSVVDWLCARCENRSPPYSVQICNRHLNFVSREVGDRELVATVWDTNWRISSIQNEFEMPGMIWIRSICAKELDF